MPVIYKKTNLPKARLAGARISPRKARLVADLIRGADLDEAMRICQFTPKKAAGLFLKLLKSARSNADQANYDLMLSTSSGLMWTMGLRCTVGSPCRWARRRIRKRSSRLTVILGERLTKRRRA
jgi:large subunit ribosomal protein L22